MAIINPNGRPDRRRQGDIYFVRIDGAKKSKDAPEGPVLAHGEATGHTHAVAPECLTNCDVFLDEAGLLVVKVKPGKSVNVVHQEHDPILLTEGDWEVRHQREYEPAGWKQVSD